MQSLLLVVWLLLVFLMTCTTGFEVDGNRIDLFFTWRARPQLGEFFYSLPYMSDAFAMQKFGHIFVFFVLSVLFSTRFNPLKAFRYSALCAVSTEILQIYLSRGGRLYDIGFDLIGITLGCTLIFLLQQHKNNRLTL